jgi:hypothetical protein
VWLSAFVSPAAVGSSARKASAGSACSFRDRLPHRFRRKP